MWKFTDNLPQSSLIRVAIGYMMFGWIIMQVLEVMAPALKMPVWTISAATIILIVLFPITLILTWLFQLKSVTPDGLGTPTTSTRKIDYVIYCTAAFVGIWTITDVFTGNDEPQDLERISAKTNPQVIQEELVFNQHSPDKSIALLPFSDLSASGDQEFFADGVTEELLDTISRIKGLRVAGRTSSFAYKDTDEDLASIGKKLRVAYILEGSIRKYGERLRISVWLTNVSNGYSVWSNSYDRTMSDIFEIQEDIAQSIVSELQVILGDAPGQLIRRDTDDQEAYALFLQARAHLQRRYGEALPNAIALLEEAIERDPAFARGWSALAKAYVLQPFYLKVNPEDSWVMAERHASRALSIDSDLAEPYAVLGYVYTQRFNYSAMKSAFDTALALDPHDITARHFHAVGLIHVGRTNDAQEQYRLIQDIDPGESVGHQGLALTYLLQGNVVEAERHAKTAQQLGSLTAIWYLGEAAGIRGDTEVASNLITNVLQRGVVQEFDLEETQTFIRGFFDEGFARTAAVEIIKTYLDGTRSSTEPILPYFLLRLGEYETAFRIFEQNQSGFGDTFYGVLWGPFGGPARQHPKFPEFAKRTGLTEYWQNFGWPDLCKSTGINTFECQ